MIRERATVLHCAIAGAEVHIWRMSFTDLDDVAADGNISADWLAPDEVIRAQRYIDAQVRQRFMVGRAALRGILADYLVTAPDAVLFCYNDQGKPALSGAWHDHPLRFNVSHANDLFVVAITWDRALGIDVEWIHPIPEMDSIAQQFFSPKEYDQLRFLPSDQRLQAFFACWTRKEAYIKAQGGGLAIPLDSFDVTFASDEPARLHRVDGKWTLQMIALPENYVGAVVIEGRESA